MAKLIVVGMDTGNGHPVVIDEQARARSVYLVGIQGTGKSTVLEQIAYQDMVNGDGLIFLDPHGDSIQNLSLCVPKSRAADVIFWDPADRKHPIGLNPFYCPTPDIYDAKADSFIAALSSIAEFYHAFQNAPRMKDILEHVAITFVVNQNHSLIEAPIFLEDPTFRKQFYPALQFEYPHVRAYWETFDDLKPNLQRELVESSLNKLRRFQIHRTMRGIFGQIQPKLNMRLAMDQKKILLVNLNRARIGESNAALIGAFIIFEILHAALSRFDIPPDNRPRFHILADEFQTFMSTAFPTLIEEGRKYGVDVVVAHQIREQLEGDLKELTRAVGNLIVFRVTAPNAGALAPEFKIEIPESPSGHLSSKFEVVRNLLSCLEQKGHENDQVMVGYQSLRRSLDRIVETMLWNLKARSYSILGHSEITSADYKIVELRRKHFEEFVDRVLYRAMTVPTIYLSEKEEGELGLPTMWQHLIPFFDELYQDLISIHKYVQDIRQAHKLYYQVHGRFGLDDLKHPVTPLRYLFMGDTFDQFREHLKVFEDALKKYNEELPPLLKELNGYLYPSTEHALTEAYTLYNQEKRIFAAIRHLIEHLKGKPYFAQVGQPEQILEKSRLYSDVGLEIANQLTNLPRFHARCKLETPDGLSNCEMTTVKLGVPADPLLAIEIQHRTWVEYASIQTPFATINYDEQSDDDDEPTFGEKKTAAHAEARGSK